MSEYENTPCPDMPHKWCTERCPACQDVNCGSHGDSYFCTKYCKEVYPQELDLTRPEGM